MMKKYPKSGPDVNGWKREAEAKTTGTLTSPAFLKGCKELGMEPTRRQASKYWKSKGIVRGRV